MKLCIILTIFICCVYGAPTQDELLQRATKLDNVIKAKIKELQGQNKGHMATLLKEEETRLEVLANQLKIVPISEVIRRAVLDEQLVSLEFRIVNELSKLDREAQTRDLIQSNANVLKELVSQEIKTLEATQGTTRQHALQAATALKQEEQRLEKIVDELIKTDDEIKVQSLEVEIRAIEVRLYEHLKQFRTISSNTTARPLTQKTQVHNRSSVTARPTVHVSGTTVTPNNFKEQLMKRTAHLQANVKSAISEHKNTLEFPNLERAINNMVDRLSRASKINVLHVLDAELHYLETKLNIYVKAYEPKFNRAQMLIDEADAMKTRIIAVEKLLPNSPWKSLANTLAGDVNELDQNIVYIKSEANNDRALDIIEMDLDSVLDRMNQQLISITV